MSFNLHTRIWPEAVRTVTAATIHAATPNYVPVGTVLTNPARIAFFQNGTDADLMFSWDGVTNHFALLAGTFLLLDVTTNQTEQAGGFAIPQGTEFWVKEIGTATTGSVYVTVFYAR